MINGFNGLTTKGKVCKDSIKKFDKFTVFSLYIPAPTGDGKFIRCKVFKKVKEFFDDTVREGDVLTIQATQSVSVWKDKEYIDYLVAYLEKN